MFNLERSAFSAIHFPKELHLIKVCKSIGVWQGQAEQRAVCQSWVVVGVRGRECILQWTPAGYISGSCTAMLTLAPLYDPTCQKHSISRSDISLIQWCQRHSVVAVGQPKISQYYKVSEATRNGNETIELCWKNMRYISYELTVFHES